MVWPGFKKLKWMISLAARQTVTITLFDAAPVWVRVLMLRLGPATARNAHQGMDRFCCAKEEQSRLHKDDVCDIPSARGAPICRAFLIFQFGANDEQLLNDQLLVVLQPLDLFCMDLLKK
jgi:hypothetical protein